MEMTTTKKALSLEKLLESLQEGKCVQVCIGLHWTAVVVDVQGELRCGLASTARNNHVHGVPEVPQAGQLETLSAFDLAALTCEKQLTLASVGAAAINALLPRHPERWTDMNAEEVIAKHGANKSVALVGHFPFTSRLRSRVGKLTILEKSPQPGDLPTDFAAEVIPKAEVVAITGTTLINHTFDGLLSLCSPDALVILLGPSTFLSPILFDYGIDLLCGSVVTDIEPVIKVVQQGGTFRQVHHAGVRLVSITNKDR
jgi:uncharacterized protein (DUF4213/DUF364 family)